MVNALLDKVPKLKIYFNDNDGLMLTQFSKGELNSSQCTTKRGNKSLPRRS